MVCRSAQEWSLACISAVQWSRRASNRAAVLTFASGLTVGLAANSTSVAFKIVFSSNIVAWDWLWPNGCGRATDTGMSTGCTALGRNWVPIPTITSDEQKPRLGITAYERANRCVRGRLELSSRVGVIAQSLRLLFSLSSGIRRKASLVITHKSIFNKSQ